MSNTIKDVVEVTYHSYDHVGCKINKFRQSRREEFSLEKHPSLVRVGTPTEAELKQVEVNVVQSVQSGSSMIRRTIARLSRSTSWDQYEIRKWAKTFFLQDPLDENIVRNVIVPKLERILTGLEADIRINVAEQVTNFRDAGVIATHGNEKRIHLASAPFRDKNRREMLEYNEGGYPNMILEATSSLIHEATHLFAQTIDYCYFEPWDAPKENFDDAGKALINADSYARFVCRVGEREG